MPTITAITPNARKPGRFAVHIDGRSDFTLSIEAIERLRLALGTVVDDRTAHDVEREAAVLATYDRALDMLASRARASAELRRLLVRKGEPTDQVNVVIDRLLTAGLLDDALFARQFARSKALGAGLSRRRLRQELARKGVARDVSDEAIEEVLAEENIDDSASIERVARKKLRTLSRLDIATQRRRLYAFLARRGYDVDDIARVLREVMQESAGEEQDSR
jgi:regulatory protein